AAAEGYRVAAARIQRGADLWDVEFTGASDYWNCVGAGWKACELLHRPLGRRSKEGATQGTMGNGCGVGREATACWRGQTGFGAACRGGEHVASDGTGAACAGAVSVGSEWRRVVVARCDGAGLVRSESTNVASAGFRQSRDRRSEDFA